MSAGGPDPDDFYRARVPAQWNRTLDEQAALAEADPAARALLDAMRRVDAAIEVIVAEGDGDERRYRLAIEGGRMSAGGDDARRPFVVLRHDLASFATIERESGDSVLGFLGALAGQAGDMKLTPTRLQNLYGLRGRARLELTGGAPMTLEARFGGGGGGEGEGGDDGPACTLRIPAEVYAALRAGERAPQDVFLAGDIEIEGDLELAMQLALAALSPD